MAVTNVISQQIINVDNDTNYYFEVAPQGDSQARFVDVTLTTNGGSPYIINNGSTIILEGKNAGGYNIFNPCILQDSNVVRIPLNNGVLSFAGIGKYIIAIYNGDNYINSFPFNIVVTEAPYDISRVEASDQYEALNQIIAKAQNSNSWIVKTVDPPHKCESGTNKNDYYLNATTGNVFYAELDTDGVNLIWKPLMNEENPPKQINLLGRVFLKYADDNIGTNMSDSPVGKPYMGLCSVFTEEAPTDPTQYTWALIKNDLNETNTKAQYAINNDITTPPTNGWKDTLGEAISTEEGSYIWTKVHLEYQDSIYFEYFTVGKNDGADVPEELKNTVRINEVLRAGLDTMSVTTFNPIFVEEDIYNYQIRLYCSDEKLQTSNIETIVLDGRVNITISFTSTRDQDVNITIEIIRKNK